MKVVDGAAGRKVVLVTGGSSGLGGVAAAYLASRGHRVYAASRRGSIAAGGATPLRMDVDDDVSVREGVEGVVERERRLDVVVNCAGFGIAGAIEETPIAAARAQFETNLFGVMRVCQRALPVMRRQQLGLIVNVSSIAGALALPFQGLYSASKFALEGFSETLSAEVRRFGIRVVVVQPGDFRTGFTAARRRFSVEGSAYAAPLARAMRVAEDDEHRGADSAGVARLLEAIVRSRRPRFRYVIGPSSEVLLMTLRRVLPGATCRWIMARHYGT